MKVEAISKTPQHDKDARKLHHSEEVFSMKFVSYNDTPEVWQPSEQPLNLASAVVAPQRPSILSSGPFFSVQGNHFDAPVLFQFGVDLVAVVGLAPMSRLGSSLVKRLSKAASTSVTSCGDALATLSQILGQRK